MIKLEHIRWFGCPSLYECITGKLYDNKFKRLESLQGIKNNGGSNQMVYETKESLVSLKARRKQIRSSMAKFKGNKSGFKARLSVVNSKIRRKQR